MMIVPVGPEPAPEYRWVGPDAARGIRARCTTTGAVLLLWSVIAGTTTLVVGFRLPTADHPISGLAVVIAALAALLLSVCAVSVVAARHYVVGEHVNVAGARGLGRTLLALAVCTLVCAALSAAVLLLTARAVEQSSPEGNVGPAVASYLLWPISCGLLATMGVVVTRRSLRPSAAPPGRHGSVPPGDSNRQVL